MLESSTKKEFKVAIVKTKEPRYPSEAPFNPSTEYPEYPFRPHTAKEPNYVYDGVRTLFAELGLDPANKDTQEWNPLGYLIKAGMNVVIKPNFVISNVAVPYKVRNIPLNQVELQRKDIFAVITHPSVLRAIVDYCWIALRGSGRITIADAPQYNCDFKELLCLTKLENVAAFVNSFRGPTVHILDLRNYWSKIRHFPSFMKALPGDPRGTVTVNLGRESAVSSHPNPAAFYGAVYDRNETIHHHTGDRQEYELSRTIMSADVIISVPKLKTHKKVGVTCNFKGFVSACTNKNYIIHYTLGSPSEGGDQFSDMLFTRRERAAVKFERWMYDKFLSRRTRRHEMIHRLIFGFFYLKMFRRFGFSVPPEKAALEAGNWYGNDTAWRMAVDLAKIMHFADQNGQLHRVQQRGFFSLVDRIMGGEGEGPLSPDPKPAGVLVGGDNLLAVDLVATRLMGFDYRKLKQFTMLDREYDFGPRALSDICVATNDENIQKGLRDKRDRPQREKDRLRSDIFEVLISIWNVLCPKSETPVDRIAWRDVT